MADATVAVDRLKALEVALQLTAQVAFDDDLQRIDGVDDRVELFRRQILRTDIGINSGDLKDALGVARSDAVDIGQRSFDTFVAGDFYSK